MSTMDYKGAKFWMKKLLYPKFDENRIKIG
jgi:hypothetical protein